jgi:hypothetical protein
MNLLSRIGARVRDLKGKLFSSPRPTRRSNRIVAGVIVVFALAASAFITFASSKLPFGGPVLSVMYCDCSGNYLVTIDDYTVGLYTPELMYTPGVTQLYLKYNISPGQYILGIWEGYDTCIVTCLLGCCTVGTYPMMEHVGTS